MLLMISLTATTGCPGCSPCEPEYGPAYHVNDTLKKYTYFVEGSKWVYQDSVTQHYDTVILLESKITFTEIQTDKRGCYIDLIDLVSYRFSSSHYQDEYYYTNGHNIINEIRNFPIKTDSTEYNSSFSYSIFHSYKKSFLNSIFNDLTRKEYSEYFIGDLKFLNVYLFEIYKRRESPTYEIKKTVFAEKKGLIRKEIKRGQNKEIWNLIDYNVQLKDTIYFKSEIE